LTYNALGSIPKGFPPDSLFNPFSDPFSALSGLDAIADIINLLEEDFKEVDKPVLEVCESCHKHATIYTKTGKANRLTTKCEAYAAAYQLRGQNMVTDEELEDLKKQIDACVLPFSDSSSKEEEKKRIVLFNIMASASVGVIFIFAIIKI